MLPFLFFSLASEQILLLKKAFLLPGRSFHCMRVCACVYIFVRIHVEANLIETIHEQSRGGGGVRNKATDYSPKQSDFKVKKW